jgi:CHAD domain-containing protein
MPGTEPSDHAVGNGSANGSVLAPGAEPVATPHVAVKVRPDDPAADAFRAALADGLYWLGVNAPRARSGDAEGIHHLRTTTRRLRSALELFRDLTDADRADRLAEELKWLGGLLGAVRDLDVMTERFRTAAKAAGCGAAEALAPLFEELGERHEAASEAFRQALTSERFEHLVVELTEAAAGMPFKEAAREPCRSALPPLVRKAWKRLKREGRALEPDSPDEAFHEVRKRAKRARYAAEAVQNALDPGPADDARRFAKRARRVQDILGAHQDAVVAAYELRKAAEARPQLGPFNFAAGRLLEREERTAASSRDEFFDIWWKLDRKKVVRWLKP